MNKNLKTLNGYCLVAFPIGQKIEVDTSGLVIPGLEDANNGILTVVSGTYSDTLGKLLGKTVYFTKFQKVRIDGANFMLVLEEDIYLVKE